ncbi:MAG: hypothetical protein ACYDBB_16060 [Armatimonadota bacterium]
MKIVAQSVVPTNPLPYLHLGYSAAAATNTRISGISGTVFIAAISVYLIAYHWKTSILARIVSIVLIGLGVMLLTNSEIIARREEVVVKTRFRVLRNLKNQLQEHVNNGEKIPDDLHSIQKAWQLPDSAIHDGWGHQLRYEKTTFPDSTEYLLQSAGEDEVFDTADDIKDSFLDAIPPEAKTADRKDNAKSAPTEPKHK